MFYPSLKPVNICVVLNFRLTPLSSAATGPDHDILQLWEMHRVVGQKYAPYDGMLVAAACWGNVGWIKALISFGANPNAMVTSHFKSQTLTAVKALLRYAPQETCHQCLKVWVFQYFNGCAFKLVLNVTCLLNKNWHL